MSIPVENNQATLKLESLEDHSELQAEATPPEKPEDSNSVAIPEDGPPADIPNGNPETMPEDAPPVDEPKDNPETMAEAAPPLEEPKDNPEIVLEESPTTEKSEENPQTVSEELHPAEIPEEIPDITPENAPRPPPNGSSNEPECPDIEVRLAQVSRIPLIWKDKVAAARMQNLKAPPTNNESDFLPFPVENSQAVFSDATQLDLVDSDKAMLSTIQGDFVDNYIPPEAELDTLFVSLESSAGSSIDELIAAADVGLLQRFNNPDNEMPGADDLANQLNSIEVSQQTPFVEPIEMPAAVPDDSENQDELSGWPNDELLTDEQELAKFDAIQNWYNCLSNPRREDTIRYIAAKREEETRRKILENRKVFEKQQDMSYDEPSCQDNEFPGPFQNDSQNTAENLSSTKPSVRRSSAQKKKTVNGLSAEEKRQSMQIGLDVILEKARQKGTPRKRKADSTVPIDTSVKKKRGRKKKESQVNPLKSLFEASVVKDARGNATKSAIPGFTSANKEKAMMEIVSQIPNADQEQARSDKRKVLEATRKFTRRVKSDKDSGWKLEGLISSLYHHQILGAAFMRERESSPNPPFGGLLCDYMGFGKTIQALANIVDGFPSNDNDQVKTTLIVVPAQVKNHWMDQITKHCDINKIPGNVIAYQSVSKENTPNPIRVLETSSIVVATYDEVRKSYPQCQSPAQIMAEVDIIEWWNDVYQNEAGPMHRMKFQRIILDEGHIIKNHLAQISIAVRALTAKFKWVLSGTPVHNGIEEFYPLFDFLGVPYIGRNYETFQKYFCRDEDGVERLTNFLRTFMFRRTHTSTLFSSPIIKLPKLEEKIVAVELCEAEIAIYEAIVDTFFSNLTGLASEPNPKLAQYRCFLVMLLMLRMCASHILTAQDMLKKLVSSPVLMAKLNSISNQTHKDDPSRVISNRITALKKHVNLPPKDQFPPEDQSQVSEELRGDRERLVKAFYEFMLKLHEDEQWGERLERAICPSCETIPIAPVITSCKHLYCEECYYGLPHESNTQEGNRICVADNTGITEAAQGYLVENIQLDSSTSGPKKGNKKKATNTKKKKTFSKWTITSREKDSGNDVDDEDHDTDWITASEGNIPSAKLTKIRELIRGWISEDQTVKVVIFTQFLCFVRILDAILQKEQWKYVKCTGKMMSKARDESLDKFRNDSEIRVMVASLKVGGIGIDMSAGNKCILVDLWWNEAIQEQAFCRLYRIGQERDVEFVILIAKKTVDDRMLEIQKRKTGVIDNTMSTDVLKDRATIKELLEMFGGSVTENEETGGMIVTRKK